MSRAISHAQGGYKSHSKGGGKTLLLVVVLLTIVLVVMNRWTIGRPDNQAPPQEQSMDDKKWVTAQDKFSLWPNKVTGEAWLALQKQASRSVQKHSIGDIEFYWQLPPLAKYSSSSSTVVIPPTAMDATMPGRIGGNMTRTRVQNAWDYRKNGPL